jgi:hypothetical protein
MTLTITAQSAAAASRARVLDGTLVAAALEISPYRDGLNLNRLVSDNGCRCAHGAQLPDDLARIAKRRMSLSLHDLRDAGNAILLPPNDSDECLPLMSLMGAHDSWAYNATGSNMIVTENHTVGGVFPDLVGRRYDRALFLEVCDRLDPPVAA